MNDIIQIVNFIKKISLSNRILNQMYSDFGSEYDHLLFYSEVRQLSEGKVL
jgi:hypothetical protein